MSGRLYELNLGVVAGRGGEPAVARLSRVEQPPFDCRRRRRAKERFEHGRSIDDDH
jgi:hypothetical protein